MACSKVFSGIVPEIADIIIQYLWNDFSTLHSCILVNRFLCRLAIPLLWEDPFSIPTRNYHFIEIYLHNLNVDDRKELSNFKINDNIFPLNNPLFNYPSYIKRLYSKEVISSIENWMKTARNRRINIKPGKDDSRLCARSIYKFLFKIFIQNNANLHTFEIILFINHDCSFFLDIIEFILQNPNFIRNIKNLMFNIRDRAMDLDNPRVEPFLSLLSTDCNLIKTLDLQFYHGVINLKNNEILKRFSSNIIRSQRNIKMVLFNGDNFDISNNLLSLKNSNCSISLNSIIFNEVDFNDITNLKEVFEKLNGLESIHLINCRRLTYDCVQQFVGFKLKTLFINHNESIESNQLLLETFGEYLENIRFGPSLSNELKEQFIELANKYCPRIRYFELRVSDDQNVQILDSTFNLIKKLGNNLKYLILDFPDSINFSSIILQELGKILPIKLKYLNLILRFNPKDFEIFLNNSKDTFIEKLLIRNIMQDETDEDILPCIKEHIMKNRRVKYLALIRGNNISLSSLNDEVKEFKSYDITVIDYFKSSINDVNFVKEMY